jgi:CHAT domain-containing protein
MEGTPPDTPTTEEPAMTALRQAANWLRQQPYTADPAYWVAQAATRYSLTGQQQATLLHNASR